MVNIKTKTVIIEGVQLIENIRKSMLKTMKVLENVFGNN